MPPDNATKCEYLRHSLAHLLAASVLELYPDTKHTIGPAIDAGFYYDFDFATPPSENDLPAIEKKMRQLVKKWTTFSHRAVTPEEARIFFLGNPYKLELVEELANKGEQITLYTSGTFTDLCRGGHVENAKEIAQAGWKLDKLAGAYWRGSEKNKQLTRIYGLAFATPPELEHHLAMREEAERRDHRKLGKELELFFVNDTVGKGLVLWLPKGTVLKNEIERFAIEMEDQGGYVRVSTPHLAKEELYLRSGHLPYYKESMYPPMVMDDGTYYLKAMNCPHHHVIYLHTKKSYRDLPIRMAEYGTVYRNELSGTLAGLLRVRGLAMNDAHIYCRKDQIKAEFGAVLDLVMHYFKLFGLTDYWFRLSLWDPLHTEKYINEPDNWKYAEAVLRDLLIEKGVPFTEAVDEAAFYGPKVDVQFRSAIGREETMSTIQLDFAAKERFGLSYTDETGRENNELFVIHRAPLSTHERFIAFLIEHYAGAFPSWLAPVQVAVLPISDTHLEWAREVHAQMRSAGIRADIYDTNDTLGKKIRTAKLQKIPYLLVMGEKEVASKTVTVESRDKGSQGAVPLATFVTTLVDEIRSRK